MYSASSEVLLNRQDLGSALTGVPNVNAYSDPDRFARTQAALARTPEVAERAIRLAGVDDIGPSELLSRSSVSPQENADLLRFTVTGGDAGVGGASSRTRTARRSRATGTRWTPRASRRARKELQGRLAELREQGATGTEVYRDLLKKEQDLRTIELLQARSAVVREARRRRPDRADSEAERHPRRDPRARARDRHGVRLERARQAHPQR